MLMGSEAQKSWQLVLRHHADMIMARGIRWVPLSPKSQCLADICARGAHGPEREPQERICHRRRRATEGSLMADPVFVGIDLAWNTNAATGIAGVDDAGVLLDAATLLSDDQIIAWMSRPDWQPVTSAVDAPLIVTNATGQRPCERMISRAFGRYKASCHTSNLGVAYFNPPRGATLAERLGWNLDPAHAGTPESPGCIEVYPHPAMVAFFKLGSVLPYKAKSGRTVEFRRSAFVELFDQMETLPHLGLSENLRWAGTSASPLTASMITSTSM